MTWTSWKPSDRRRPAGAWRQYGAACRVSGLKYRPRNVLRFAKAAQSAGDGPRRWALEIRREPSNAHDSNALAVYGCWTAQHSRWLFWSIERRHAVQLGYVSSDLAARLAMAGPDLPIAAELYEIAVARDGPDEETDFGVIVKIILLVPSATDEVWGPAVRLLT